MSTVYHSESSIKLNVVKQKIIQSLLLYNYELIAMCFGKLYTASSSSKTWLYTELEGGLTLVIDYARKSARFLLFDLNTFEIIFECELHKNFNLLYTCLTETLHCFEVSKGFIGFCIPDKISAQIFFKSVSKLTDSIISKKIKEKIIPNKNDMKSNSAKVLALVKEKLAGEYFFKENVLNEKKLELDLNKIERVINMIEYDNEKEKFFITGNAEEINELVGKVKSVKYSDKNGLKITDTVAYAMEIYQSMVNSMVKNNEVKSNKIEETAHKKSKLFDFIKQEVDGYVEPKINIKVDQPQSNKNEPQPSKKVVPPIPVIPSVPKGVPAVPKGVPPVPKGVPAVPKGVPPVPKGVPTVPKVIPPIPGAQKSLQGNVTNLNPNLKNNIQSSTIEDNKVSETAENESHTNIANESIEEKMIIRKKEPPKVDMMSELRMKLANRGSAFVVPIQNSNNISLVKPPVIINTNKNIILANEESNLNLISNTQNENVTTKIQNNVLKSPENLINTDIEITNPISVTTSKLEQVPEKKSNISAMKEALNRKFGGVTLNPTPKMEEIKIRSTLSPTPKIEEIKTAENNTILNPKPIVLAAQSSNVPKMNMSKMVEQMEKSYNGGSSETKEEQKIVSNIKQIEIKPIQAPAVPIATPLTKSNISKVPGVPVPPPLNIPLPPKINLPVKQAPQKNKVPELTLMEQISKGVKLQSVETVEKTGLDFIKKRDSIPKNSELEKKVEIKGDLFAEMRKVQLKKVNK